MLDNWEMLLYAIIPSVRAKTTNSWPKFRLNRRITRMSYMYGHAGLMACVLAMEDASEATLQLQFNNNLCVLDANHDWWREHSRNCSHPPANHLWHPRNSPWITSSVQINASNFISSRIPNSARHSADRDVGDCSWSGSPPALVRFWTELVCLRVKARIAADVHLFALLNLFAGNDGSGASIDRAGRTLGRTDDRDKCVAVEEIRLPFKNSQSCKMATSMSRESGDQMTALSSLLVIVSS